MKTILVVTSAAALLALAMQSAAQNQPAKKPGHPATAPAVSTVEPATPDAPPGVAPASAWRTAGLPADRDQFGGYGGGYGNGFGGNAVNFRPAAARDAVPPILVQFASADPAVAQQLEEDLTVMSHIIDQALERGLGEDTPPSKMGVPLIYTSGSRSARAMYIGGDGPLFMIKVNMPLMAAPAPTEKPTASAVDTEWESARREVLDSGDKTLTLTVSAPAADLQFDGEQVEALQRTLVGALKNAANIRGLQPEEHVSIAVFGQPMPVQLVNVDIRDGQEQNGNNGQSATKSSSSSRSKAKTRSVNSRAILNPVSQRGTVLTMRVKVKDIAEFAQGKIQPDAFAARVTTTTYAGAGYGITSVNSWLQSGRAAVTR
ncbi:MAG: hypothetical protein U1G07_23010 [Verrucomicrobiota bacterium]